jgi:hypothetical protein
VRRKLLQSKTCLRQQLRHIVVAKAIVEKDRAFFVLVLLMLWLAQNG